MKPALGQPAVVAAVVNSLDRAARLSLWLGSISDRGTQFCRR